MALNPREGFGPHFVSTRICQHREVNWSFGFLSKDTERCAHFSFSKPHTYRRQGAVLVALCPGPLALWCPRTSTVLPADTAPACSSHQCRKPARSHAGNAGLHTAQPHILRGLEEKQYALRSESLKFQSHLCLIPLFAYLGEKKKKRKKNLISWLFSVKLQVTAQNVNSPSSFPLKNWPQHFLL